MATATKFIDVILPLAIPNTFTYRVPTHLNESIKIGERVIVPFGKKNKLETALIKEIHTQPPKNYEAKYLDSILDVEPIVNKKQLQLWDWIVNYYLTNPGDVFNAALPSAFKLSSELKILLNSGYSGTPIEDLSDQEYLVFEALEVRGILTMDELNELLNANNVHKTLKSLVEKRAIVVDEEIKEKFVPKLVTYVRLTDYANKEKNLELFFKKLSKATKQLETLLSYLKLNNRYHSPTHEVKKEELMKQSGSSHSIIKQMVDKNIFEVYEKEESRFKNYSANLLKEQQLNEHQQTAYDSIITCFEQKDVTLLHGVTGSGKTEIYIKLIKKALSEGKQVIYLLPEIALTTQLIVRLRNVFGDLIGVYHSKFNANERVEVWNGVLANNQERFRIIMGARSSLFLPYCNLGLIIIDEEHENSFKQFDPSPRYHARDTAIVLAKIHNAKVLLGSATPSVESFYNAEQKKYGYVKLEQRFGGILMPEVFYADVKEATRKKKMKSHFTPEMLKMMQDAFDNKEQVILFQNRRGYAPFMICEDCGQVPECNHCDVSLTYHKHSGQLKCHYCGSSKKMPVSCPACGSTRITLVGFGTEQIEEELSIFFPKIKVARMDADSTRNKNAYHQIITDFENKNIDVLVGTQMVTKGLDFDNVALVGILNADGMLKFPDFRAFERSFQLMCQVSGRAGRKNKRGKVLIQTYEPKHPIIQKVIQSDYLGMYNDEISQRQSFQYPPFYRIIEFTLKHANKDTLNAGADEFADVLKKKFGKRILGPEFPVISRVKNQYIKQIVLKIERTLSVASTREAIKLIKDTFESKSLYKSVKISIDVDPM